MKYKSQQKTKSKKNKRSKAEIDKEHVYASNETKYSRSDIIEKIIKICKGVKM